MLNNIQPGQQNEVYIKFADDLTSSIMVKGGDDCAPVEVENIVTGANNNEMTINLTKIKELIVRGKIERTLPPVVSDIHQEIHLKILGV